MIDKDGRSSALRAAIRAAYLADEADAVTRLAEIAGLDDAVRASIANDAADLVRTVRSAGSLGLMQSFLGEYGLSTKEGVALMCLAEALLRVPDAATIDALISDKITPADWGRHLGRSSSSLVNASTWALLLTGRVLKEDATEDLAETLREVLRRVGEPVIRTAVGRAMREMGRQFVLGRDVKEAATRARAMETKGYTYSYDMLGEAARTDPDAKRYHLAYSHAISVLGEKGGHADIRANPGISVKLSALHPRYEEAQRDRVMAELVPRARSLALLAKSANMGFNVDAEEADRLDLSLDAIAEMLSDPALGGWDGFGVVVQAYGQRAPYVLDWLYDLAGRLDRRLMVRLVKGAYWDTEIKRAQVLGLQGFPVFTRKNATDVSYIACARKLLAMADRIYPQFATHNAHTAAAVLRMAGDRDDFEFQRLHGMGEALHEAIRERHGRRCRIYAPVGAHKDLLAYLVRRLLENGANSSFVNQIVDEKVPPEDIARDPFAVVEGLAGAVANPAIARPEAIFQPDRRNSKGWDLTDPTTLAALEAARAPFSEARWSATPMVDGRTAGDGPTHERRNPARSGDVVGTVREAQPDDVEAAFKAAEIAFEDWGGRRAAERARVLNRVGDLFEAHAPELMALAAREAGKTLLDAVGEIREATDFCRYYPHQAERLEAEDGGGPRGIFVCISPWNFPLAIFTGQIVAALAAGDCVLAKPAAQTPLIAARAVQLMHEAGVPRGAVQLLPGRGSTIGTALTSDPRTAGVCFTGSTETAMRIHRAIADGGRPDAPLIAETGGLNAMIVDSTALPEQAVGDIVASAFQSAGQRCSALRMLYVQSDVETPVLDMLAGAMDELRVGDPWVLSTDVGPVIDRAARDDILAHCRRLEGEGRLLKITGIPDGLDGSFVAPSLYRLSGIEELGREIFGPVLHLATYQADEIDRVVKAVNDTGYGLTFGLHTRVDKRVQQVVESVRAGNIYVNRNQIGAVVGSQPFGGMGLSGTGPKAGGPLYVARFRRMSPASFANDAAGPGSSSPGGDLAGKMATLAARQTEWAGRRDRVPALREALADEPELSAALDRAALIDVEPVGLPGPTGESNRLSLHPRGVFVCFGGTVPIVQALALGNAVLAIGADSQLVARLAEAGAPIDEAGGPAAADDLGTLPHLAGVCARGDQETLSAMRRAIARRDGPIAALVTDVGDPRPFVHEKVLCIDTTAAGGNATLLAEADA
ncbi:MAG: bifunctional proline dehydrogenase/L-glutamate gamma-semialdehyde dehydrogenase PutA [Alphaproteobacteria bacterium]